MKLDRQVPRSGTEGLRMANRALVLRALRELGPSSHTRIGEWTGLSSATVSSITGDLAKEHILENETAARDGGRGRPRSQFSLAARVAHIAAIRIVHDRVEYSLVDYRGRLIDRFERSRPPDEMDTSAFQTRFGEGMQTLLDRNHLRPENLHLVSISTKGVVKQPEPLLVWSPVFGDAAVDFDALLPRWQGRIVLTNEARFSALSAARRVRRTPGGPLPRRSATLSLDNAIGLGLVTVGSAGQLQAIAPTFGHMNHVADGPLCRCGAHGCIEALAGFYGILRTAFSVPPETIPAKFIPLDQMDQIAHNARSGDRQAQYAFRRAGEALGIGMSRLLSLQGTMPINITGPGIRFFDLLGEAFHQTLATNMEVRFGNAPELHFIEDEGHLIFDGNVASALARVDETIAAGGKADG